MNKHLQDIFDRHNILIMSNDGIRNAIDILEDLYLKINGEEWNKIVQEIANKESIEGSIFDEARNRPYKS